MTVSIRSMRYFVTALTHGSISRAATDLNVAASAVAAGIDQVEAQFQLKLVNRRRSRGITPTAGGKVLLRKFANLLEEYEAVLAGGADLKQALKGELRIGYYAPVAPAFLPAILSGFVGPDAKITFYLEECDNDRAQSGLLAGDFDAILFVSDVALPQIEFDVLIEAPAYCLTAADHPLAGKTTVRLKDLARESIIVLNRPIAVDYYRKLFADARQAPRVIAHANAAETVRSFVGAGHGCAVLNMLPVTDISYAGDRLAAVPISDPLPPLSLAVGYGKSNPRRIVSHFVEKCRAYFQGGRGQQHTVRS